MTSAREPTLTAVAVHGIQLTIVLDKVKSTVDGGRSSIRAESHVLEASGAFLLRRIIIFTRQLGECEAILRHLVMGYPARRILQSVSDRFELFFLLFQ
jgi:hypothetical protein